MLPTFSLLLPLVAPDARAFECGTPAVLAALHDAGPVPFAFAVAPPARLDGVALPPPPAGGKAIYGSPYSMHLETDNFTVNWWDGSIPRADAEAAADALETAWDRFIAQGWTPPVSSDRYLLWVLLDKSLGGTTGYTTEYFTDEFGDGYPVIYLNPDYAYDDAFWASLSAHELMHAFQYAVRDFDSYRDSETWYWEASATWASELADPDVDGHHYIAAWYADQSALRYDSTVGSHQYGMFVLNAWLDEHVGADTMRDVWTAGASRSGDTWDEIIADTTARTPGEVWGGFTGAYGNNDLDESDAYADVPLRGTVADGDIGELPYLGTHYFRVGAAATITVEGDAVLGVWDEVDTVVEVDEGDVLAVTGLVDGASYRLAVGAPGSPDTDTDEDTDTDGGGPGGDGGGDDGDDGRTDDDDDGAPSLVDGDDGKGGCAALSAPSALAPGMLGLLALLGRRRRGGGHGRAGRRSGQLRRQ